MKFTLSWLHEHLSTNASVQQVVDAMTMAGLEVEGVEDPAAKLAKFTVAKVVEASKKLFPILVVGAPLRLAGRLYNSAIVVHRGTILGVVPKTYLPNYREFYEKRHFVSDSLKGNPFFWISLVVMTIV